MGIETPVGARRWVSINSAPLRRPGEPQPYAAISTFRDITAQRKSVETIAQQLEDLSDAKTQLEEANTVLERLATSDELTGLKNYRMFRKQLERAVRRAQRLNQPLSLLMIDVDRFKQYNDRFGHPAGDTVLRKIGEVLSGTARSSDLVARYGGEEFVVLLPSTDADRARIAAERFRAAVESVSWQLHPVTASVGIATHVGAWADAVALTEEADQALYRSKQLGRNRVTHVDDRHAPREPLHALVY